MYLPNLIAEENPEENNINYKVEMHPIKDDIQYYENPLNSFHGENHISFSDNEPQNYEFVLKNKENLLIKKPKENNIRNILHKKTLASLISESSIQSDSFDALLKNEKHNKTAFNLPDVSLDIEIPTKINDLSQNTPIFGKISKIVLNTFRGPSQKSSDSNIKHKLSIDMYDKSKEVIKENNLLSEGLKRNLQTTSEPTLGGQKNVKVTPRSLNEIDKYVISRGKSDLLVKNRSKVSCVDVKNEIICKICLDDGETEIMGKLINPCQCAGSVKYVHDECLKTWIISKKLDLEKASCEICKIKFTMKMAYNLRFHPKLILEEGLTSFLSCICLGMLLITLIGIIVYIFATWYYFLFSI